jgi:hypothetical protein
MKKNIVMSWFLFGKDRSGQLILAVMVLLGFTATAQTSYTFVPAGATGTAGPTQGQANTAYSATNLNGSVTVVNGYQYWVVPNTELYSVRAIGASGGGVNGGFGADLEGSFFFNAGDTLIILPGQEGMDALDGSTTGGGGSFVVLKTFTSTIVTSSGVRVTPLVIAGGGGGNPGTLHPDCNGNLLTNGYNGAGQDGGGTGGVNGNGGGISAPSGNNRGGGGGGFLTNGDHSSTCGTGGLESGKSFLDGAWGGFSIGCSTSYPGGFGCGGGSVSSGWRASGGGGGYSGGGGGQTNAVATDHRGGGGGSFNSGTGQTNQLSANTGDGRVIITRLCDVNLTASSNPICIGSAVTLSTNAGSNIQWSNGSTAAFITVSPSSTSQYTVTGTSSGSTACTSTVVLTVTVNPLPSITSVVSPSMLCVGNTATVTASGAGTYTWSHGVTAPTATFNPVVNTVYSLTATDHNNCVNTHTVEVFANTNVLSVTSDTFVCAGNSLDLNVSGALSYTWSIGTHFPSVPVIPAATTVYTVSGTDMYSCVLSGSVTVTVHPKPAVTAAADQAMICIGESVVLTAAGANTYQWSSGATGSSVTLTPPVDILYSYTVTGTDNNSCTNIAVVTVSVSNCLGLNETEQSLTGLSVYPNPTDGIFTIQMSGQERAHITVTDVSGRVITSTVMNGDKTGLDLSGFAAGVYYIKVQAAGGERTVKLLKQ